MSTVLIVLIAILIAYIIYMLANSSGDIPSFGAPKTETGTSKKPTKVQPKPKATPKPVTASGSAEETKVAASVYKNPETGETASNPTNYRFAKRWIKDALVSEGLLDRRYSNNELNKPEVSKRVKKALDQFREMDKYQDA